MSPSSSAARSTSFAPGAPPAAPDVYGSTEPRLWTPPLVPLTPETSYGFDLIDFARDVCGTPFDPWQEWLSIHVGELLPDGRPRFRKVLILVARQNGKTLWAKVLVHFWMHMDQSPLTLITSTDRSYASRTWTQIHEAAAANEWMKADLGPNPLKLTTSLESFKTAAGAELTFKANNGSAGRSMTLRNWLCDEVREHRHLDALNSASNAMAAVHDAQAVFISNEGDDGSTVLDSLYIPAVRFIETGEGDPRLGAFIWSAPPGSEPDDPDALRAANPNLNRPGHGPELEVLVAAGRQAKRAGGLELSGHRTEVLCQRVALLDPAIDPDQWAAAKTSKLFDLAEHRDRVALCIDVSLDGSHASLVAAAEVDGKVYVDAVRAWSGHLCIKALRAELPDLVRKVRPRSIGWFPNGPAAVLAADMQENRAANWPPRRVVLSPITTDAAGVCMALAELVKTREVRHAGDPMLTAHVSNAQKLRIGDRWVFTRRGSGPVDGTYALAGAVWLARTLPAAPPRLQAL